MPKKFRIVAASVLLLVAAATFLLEHLHILSGNWSRGIVISAVLTICVIAARFECRSA